MYKATLINVMEVAVEVHTTTNHPASHYGVPVWVDDEGNPYVQFCREKPDYSINPLYRLVDVRWVDEEE